MLRAGHGNGAGRPHVELPSLDELPEGLHAGPACGAAQALPAPARRADGTLCAGEAASDLARRAATARWAKAKTRVRMLEALGIRYADGAGPPPALLPFLIEADEFVTHEIQRLAQTAGGGICGAGPAACVQNAALQLAASRYLFSLGDPDSLSTASRIADSARQNLLAAFVMVAKEAKARPKQGNAILAAIEAAGAEA